MPSTMGDSRGGLAKPLRSYLVEFLGCISVIFVVVLIMSYSSVNAVNIANTQSDAVGSSNSYATTNRPDAYKALRGEILNVNADHSVKAVNSKYFKELISTASQTQRKRKMTDLTKDSPNNTMQVLLNTWIEGSYSPVHRHDEYSEAFVILEGALAFFTFNDNGDVKCNVITSEGTEIDKAIIIEAKQWHAMTAAPKEMGYPGHAIVFEISGHKFEANKPTKALASFAPSKNNGLDGDEEYFNKILKTCK